MRPGKRHRRLPLRGVFSVGGLGDVWHKQALSAVVALAVPDAVLLLLDRLDLAVYTSAGALCALYAHGLPYRVRARTLLGVAAGMVASVGVALTAAGLTGSAPVLVVVAALLAAAHKVACDAARIGPPGNLIFTFIGATCAFLPQRLGDVPFHLALVAAAAALAWLVCMAPALVRPEGPQRTAVARALEAAMRLAHAECPAATRARHDAAAAVNAAWHTLLPSPEGRGRRALERLLARVEASLPAVPRDEAGLFANWAADLRRNRPVPEVSLGEAGAAGLAGIVLERAAPAGPGLLRMFHPASPLFPIGVRVAVGSALAGLVSLAAGVGHPYWAVVTAAAVFQANATLSWQRALQRALGNVVGLLVFTALLPVSRTGALALVLLTLALQFSTEALMTRNYWLGTVCVTPMALLLTELPGYQPAWPLVRDRWLDTAVGVAAGLLGCLLVTNRRSAGRIDHALRRVAAAQAAARHLLARDPREPGETARVRGVLVDALVELRRAADVAAGEWWQRALPEEQVARAEREGHRLLARLAVRDRDRVGCERTQG
ncbi:FUSC family protein [Microbispora sp. NPDC049633]|uniref:FUSC family protein n=1 Tax=Microbispora sp. NPDC049633 TaxID=3154355 RepID=UPI00342BFE62